MLTFRRNEDVARLLETLGTLTAAGASDRPDGWDVTVLVVDNDPDAGARQVAARAARRAATPGRAPVRYVHEPRPGIASGRARAMAEAQACGADVLAFVDDDEEPRPGWLTALLRTRRDTGAAAVAGRIVARHPPGIHPWLVTGRFFERRNLPTGTVVAAAPAGNLLLDVAQVRDLGVRFQTDLGLRGGEDTLFTRQLTAAGGRIVFCRESVIVDPVPPERATIGWVMRRIYSQSSGEADVRVRAAGAQGRDARRIRLATAGGGVGRVLGGVVRLGAGAVRRDGYVRADGVRTLVRGVGMVAGALTTPYVEYRRADGERPRASKES